MGNSNPNSRRDNKATTLIATPETVVDQIWYANSGSTNHTFVDSSNMSISTKYNDNQSLFVGNGSKLPVAHIGSTIIKNYTHHSPIHFRNILHVPHIAKNLLSISRLTTDNHAIVEFYDKFCLVKDKITGAVMLRGILHKGLYHLMLPTQDNNS